MSRLSVAAALLVLMPWIVIFAAVKVADLLGFPDLNFSIVSLAVTMSLCSATSLVVGVVAILSHANDPKLRGLAFAVLAVVSSIAELSFIVHLYATGDIF